MPQSVHLARAPTRARMVEGASFSIDFMTATQSLYVLRVNIQGAAPG